MKLKHNKKRNTAFLFESLVRELTKSIVFSKTEKTQKIKTIIKEHFQKGSILSRELDCFKALAETFELDTYTAEKLIFQAKKEHESLNDQEIFVEQSRLIKTINSQLSMDVYNNFVPNYRSYATIAQVFSKKTPVKQKVLMERQLLQTMTAPAKEKKDLKPVDTLVLKTFASSFNDKYDTLLPEQKILLNRFMTLNENSRADFSVYLLEELKRLEQAVTESLEMQDVKNDALMHEATMKVIKKIQSINLASISESSLMTVMKIQNLVREYSNDD